MPKTKEYDDQLVELLGRGELSEYQIAERVGLSSSQVGRIARGETRPDLQPRINAAMRRTLKQAWKNGGRLATESGEPLSGRTAHAAFDRYLAVELIASGQLTLSQIARWLGVNKTTVWGITTGRTHPELQGRIAELTRMYHLAARRLAAKWLKALLSKHIKHGMEGSGETARKCREFAINKFLDDGVENEVPPAERDFGPELRDLPEPLKSQVIEALGGPVDEDEETGDWLRRPEGPEVPIPISGQNVAHPPSGESPQPGAAAPQKKDAAGTRSAAFAEASAYAEATADESADRS